MKLDAIKQRISITNHTKQRGREVHFEEGNKTEESYQNLNDYKEEILSNDSQRDGKRKESYYEQIKNENDEMVIQSQREIKRAKVQSLEEQFQKDNNQS